jgi:Nucleotide modification associated domain 3
MQIILSRKGFDEESGGMASPIFPDGTMLSLPIPSKDIGIPYNDLFYNNISFFDIIKSLNPRSKINKKDICHLDPDIKKEVYKRNNSWKPLFGQCDSALGHLLNENIQKGDIFLFFGSFKHVHFVKNMPKYVKGADDIHVLYGYLQIEKRHGIDSEIPSEFDYHPHAIFEKKQNCIFEASEKLDLLPQYSGSGNFKFNDKLVLTKSGYTKSKWQLPDIVKDTTITFHNKDSWFPDFFQSVGRGQEFVIKANDKVIEWTKDIIKSGMNNNN